MRRTASDTALLVSLVDFFRTHRGPRDSVDRPHCPVCHGTGLRTIDAAPKPKPEPKPCQCYVQGCSEPATWHDLVVVSFPMNGEEGPGPLMSEATRRRVKLGLNTCDLHCWELDQAMKAREARFAVSTAKRRPYKPRSES